MTLFPSHRMDLIIKYLYFSRSHLTPVEGLFQGEKVYEELYKYHIEKRTKGKENATPEEKQEGLESKNSVDCYIKRAQDLKDSMSTHGFLPKWTVKMYECGAPLNGAHRIACAESLGIPTIIERVRGRGLTWDIDEIFPKGKYIYLRNLVLHEWVRQNEEECAFVVSWNSKQESEILNFFKDKKINIIDSGFAWSHFDPDKKNLYDLLLNIYAPETESFYSVLKEKAQKLCEQENLCVKYYLIEKPGEQIIYEMDQSKYDLRFRLRESGFSGKLKNLVHASSIPLDNLLCASTFYNPTNLLRFINLICREGRPSLKLDRWLASLEGILEKYDLYPEDICIVGSSVLDTFGIRESTDIDIIVKSEKRKNLTSGNMVLGEKIDLARKGYHRISKNVKIHNPARAEQEDDLIIDDPQLHFRYKLYKFAHPQIVIDRKKEQGRPKDLKDVELAEKALRNVPFIDM